MIKMSREEAIGRIQDHKRIHSKKEPFTPYLDKAFYMAIEALKEQRPHGEWIPKQKRVQVDETDEERIFETKLEWFCSSCGKSFGCRKPDDSFCKYCGSDNRPKEGDAE